MNIKLKYWLISICLGLTLFLNTSVLAQCDDKLVDKAILKSGNDALFIREFVIKPNSQSKKKKSKTAAMLSKYDVRLNKGIVYRFIVENEENSLAQGLLQLRKDNIILASTYDIENQLNIGNFDYLCDESGAYQVLLSFVSENTGCTAGAMFAVLQDSMSVTAIIDSMAIQNVLYTETDNFIDIAATDIPDGTLEVSISRGLISKDGGLYKIRVEEPGKLTVDVIAKDRNGKVTETFKSEFIVMEPMLPIVSFLKSTGGLIKKQDILNSSSALEIHNYRNDFQFKIKSFTVTKSISSIGIRTVNDNRLNFSQLNLIKELKNGDNFYITNIEIEDSKGKVYQLQPLGFIISEESDFQNQNKPDGHK